MSENQEQKIKDLEQAIKRALDDDSSSEDTKEKTEAPVSNNANAAFSYSPVEVPKEKPKDAPQLDVSSAQISKIDSLLSESDPQFLASMFSLEKEVKEHATEVKGVTFQSKIDFKEVESITLEKTLEVSLWDEKIKNFKAQFIEFRKRCHPKNYPWKLWFKSSFEYIVTGVKSFFGQIKLLTSKQWMLLLGVFLLSALSVLLVLRGLGSIHLFKIDYADTFESIADKSYDIPADEKWITVLEAEEPFRFMLMIGRTVINLRPSNTSSSNPMMAFELYIDGSEKETVLEIQNHMQDYKDKIQRIAENFKYDDLTDIKGKLRFKKIIRQELNKEIKHGHIKDIYFKTLLIKR